MEFTSLGSNNKGVVKASEIFDYVSYYGRFLRKQQSKQFQLGLEKADEIVLRNRTFTMPMTCDLCSKPVSINQLHSDGSEVSESQNIKKKG